MRRKVLPILLVVCVLAGMAAVSNAGMNVLAEEYSVEKVGVTSGDYEYEIVNLRGRKQPETSKQRKLQKPFSN